MELPIRRLTVQVFSLKSAQRKRGADAESMILCIGCGKYEAVFVNQIARELYIGVGIDDKPFNEIVWERWRCLHCQRNWIEKYGICNGLVECREEKQGSIYLGDKKTQKKGIVVSKAVGYNERREMSNGNRK